MDERKVHKVQLMVECERVEGDPKVRVYLSEVRKITWTQIKKVCNQAFVLIFRILVSIAITFIFGIWAIECAYLDRGYRAYGGECLLIVLVFFIAFKVSDFKKN